MQFEFLQFYSFTVFEKQNREDPVIVPTHYLLLEILLIARNTLIFNTNLDVTGTGH